MNERQQEPPSSHLHGAGHNTSISRQRRTTKNKVGYSLPFLFLEISDGQIGSRSECRSRCRCQTLTRRRSEQEHRQQYIHSRADKRSQRQRTGSGAHGGSESQYRRTGEQRQQRRRRRQQAAREDGKDTQEKQDGQAWHGGADRMEQNMRHNETFKCAMMVAWTSGRVRVKQRDRTT